LGCPGWLPEMAQVSGEGDDAAMPDTEPAGEVFSQVNSHSDSHSSSRADIDGMAIDLETARTTTPNPQPVPHKAEQPATAAVDQDALFGKPQPDPASSDNNEPTPTQRAFGIARAWVTYRAEQGTPVIASGKGKEPEVHKLRSLIEPFTKAYTDNEIKQALKNIGISIPTTARLDVALSELRVGDRNQQGRLNGGLRTSTPPSNAPRRISKAETCPKHRGQKAGKCGLCRAEAHGVKPEVTVGG
jgi:hypothetical protein